MLNDTSGPLLSGQQYTIEHGLHKAVICSTGAAVRLYQVDGRDVFVPFDADDVAPVHNASILAPWPNRLADGVYTDRGVKRQLPINEVPRQNALHGLVSWAQWQLEFHSQHELTMSYDLPARPGWPFLLSFKVTYSMNDDGLTCSFEVTNRGKEVAPYGSGFHPWLSTGGALLDECDVQLDVATHITVDERLLPTGTEPVSGDYDLRVRRSLKGLDLDDAWIDPGVGPDGLTWCKLFCPDGAVPAVWADSSMPAWQVCSADHIPAHYRFGLAAEPMTCVANAFNTGDLLIELQPGVTHTVRWGATLLSD